MKRLAGIIGLASLGYLFAFGGSAGAYVYWANEATGSIGRAANDGTHVEPNFITGIEAPTDVAVDAGHVYWVDFKAHRIGRANIDGSGVAYKFIVPGGVPKFVAVGGSHIFWGDVSSLRIGRANIDGTSPVPGFLKAETEICGVAVDAGHVYWGHGNGVDTGYVARAPVAGGPPVEREFVKIPASPFLCRVGVSPAFIFWTNWQVGTGTNIGRADAVTGGVVDPSFIGAGHGPCGVAVLRERIFWANSADGTIGAANLDSSGLQETAVQTGAGPGRICGIAADELVPPPEPPPSGDTTPPQTRITKGPGRGLARGKAKISFTSSEFGSTFTCKLDRGAPARCRSPKHYKGLRPGRHVFRVWATDRAGNKDPTPATRRFKVPSG